VAKDEANMPPMIGDNEDGADDAVGAYNAFWNYNWMQRLDTKGGLAPSILNHNNAHPTCTGTQDLNKTHASPYTADYVLAFTPISIPSPPDNDVVVDLPRNCFQALPMFGEGVQIYQFWNGNWTLSQPKATLRAYSTTNTTTSSVVSGSQGLIGSHYFANVGCRGTAGTGAGWVLGGNCSGDSCLNRAGSFRGTLNASSTNGNSGNIPVLLIQKDGANTPNRPSNFLNQYTWMQRLNTVGGTPPAKNGRQGEFISSPYTSDYVLALCATPNSSSGRRDGNGKNKRFLRGQARNHRQPQHKRW
jgi:Protein of unknown function (DUF3455)